MLDAKWLEILKATGAQTFAVAVASGVFLFLEWQGYFGVLDSWVRPLTTFVFLVSSALAVTSFAQEVRPSIRAFLRRRQFRESVRKYIPHMTRKDKEIIAYLLVRNQKMFEADIDGGHAKFLLAKGIVVRASQMHTDGVMPMCIPDTAWDVLNEYRFEFPLEEMRDAKTQPWRVHWMAR